MDETLFAVMKVKGTALKYEGTYGQLSNAIKGPLDGAFPLVATNLTFRRPFSVSKSVTSTASGEPIFITTEWTKNSPKMLEALITGDDVDITIFTVVQGESADKYQAGVTITMTKGRITNFTMSPGNYSQPTSIQMEYVYKSINIKDYRNVEVKFENLSGGVV